MTKNVKLQGKIRMKLINEKFLFIRKLVGGLGLTFLKHFLHLWAKTFSKFFFFKLGRACGLAPGRTYKRQEKTVRRSITQKGWRYGIGTSLLSRAPTVQIEVNDILLSPLLSDF